MRSYKYHNHVRHPTTHILFAAGDFPGSWALEDYTVHN